MDNEAKCPFSGKAEAGRSNRDWWPNQLDLSQLYPNPPAGDPMGPAFDYAKEFKTLNLDALKKDIAKVMTTSQAWWPADFGHYGPLFIRMAWHSAGTYRIHDGRGGAGSGMLRFAPLGSWPDNANLDKPRRLLWPIKQKYGRKISWADLMVLTGNVALESMGFKTFGFGGGREDVWEPQQVNWGSESTWLGDERYSGDRQLANPFGAVQMGLIYVNPEGPNGNPDPLASARDIRETFRRMAMNDEETVALIAGGHTFGKTHGAGPATHVGREPEGGNLEEQGFGWKSSFKTGSGAHAITSGLEVTWSQTPTKWSNHFFENLFGFEWELTTSPAGAKQWKPKNGAGAGTRSGRAQSVEEDRTVDADDRSRAAVRSGVREDLAPLPRASDEFATAFAKAWFKLTHRDMGPISRYLGKLVPAEPQLWQDPVPKLTHTLIGPKDIAALKERILASKLSIAQLITTAWASASSFRGTDKRGGRQRRPHSPRAAEGLGRQHPPELAKVLKTLEKIQKDFKKPVSMADLIVLGGCAGRRVGAKKAGHNIKVPFAPGRTDATQEQTDVTAFAVLEPDADGFRNYLGRGTPCARRASADRAGLPPDADRPEMTVLTGGLRVLNANTSRSNVGVFTKKPGTLTNDFFVNLLDMDTEWKPTSDAAQTFEGRGRGKGALSGPAHVST